MGFGDDIMATAYAKAAVQRAREPGSPQEDEITKVVFGDPETFHDPKTNRLSVHWSEVFEGNQYVLQQGESVQGVMCMADYPGHRMYIDYEKSEWEEATHRPGVRQYTRFYFHRDFSAPVGELYFTQKEIEQVAAFRTRVGGPYILIEPRVKGTMSGQNKAWPEERWGELTENLLADGHCLVQPIKPAEGGPVLREYGNVYSCVTKSFRQASALVSGAELFIGTDGGLHHAAAAVGTPAVVLWSGYASPKHLGYMNHANIYHFDISNPSGELTKSDWCRENMEKITVAEVFGQAENELIHAKVEKENRDEREKSGGADNAVPDEAG